MLLIASPSHGYSYYVLSCLAFVFVGFLSSALFVLMSSGLNFFIGASSHKIFSVRRARNTHWIFGDLPGKIFCFADTPLSNGLNGHICMCLAEFQLAIRKAPTSFPSYLRSPKTNFRDLALHGARVNVLFLLIYLSIWVVTHSVQQRLKLQRYVS